MNMDTITIQEPHKILGNAMAEPLKIGVESLSQVSDGYHTIEELYDHRITLYIALCRTLVEAGENSMSQYFQFPWRSKVHSDGSTMDGWFIMGIGYESGGQISYHLPLSRWDETIFAKTLDKAPAWDGHTSADVLERLKTL